MTKKLLIIGLVLLFVTSVFAEVRVDWGGKIYSQYRWTNSSGNIYWNSGSFGSFSSGASMWPGYGRGDKKYGNFMRTEVEFEVNATVSQYVRAYIRTKTIFNSDESTGDGESSASSWADDWDDSRGFFKLRGFLIQVNPNIEFIKQIELGTPMGLPFNKWLVSDRRYIDRDNIKGIVVRGAEIGEIFSWNLARMWNAGYMGPGWNGVNSFRSEDATYALNFGFNPMEDKWITNLDMMMFSDGNLDPEDDDVAGVDDGTVDRRNDFQEIGFSLDSDFNITDEVGVNLVGIFTMQKYADELDVNEDNIADNLSWVTMQTPPHWFGINEVYADVNTFSGIFTLNTTDPFGIGFTPKAQVFYLDNNLYTPFGSRREDDMLLINGGINALRFTDGSDYQEGARQHQSLKTFLYGGGQSAVNEAMTDNNYLRLGEDFYESAIGYMGATLDGDMDFGEFNVKGQINYLMKTDNNDGKIDEVNDNYEGDDMTNAWYYEEPKDFSAIVGDLAIRTTMSGIKLGLIGKFGNWQDVMADYSDNSLLPVGTHNIEMTAMVVELQMQKQLTNAISLELRPRYQNVDFNEAGTDAFGAEYDSDYANNDIVLNHKWVYNFGGFDFWLRGEHFIKRTFETKDSDLDLSWSTVHAAFEVKF